MLKRQKKKQVLAKWQDKNNKLLSAIGEFGKDAPYIAEIWSGPLAKFVSIAVQDSGRTGNTEES